MRAASPTPRPRPFCGADRSRNTEPALLRSLAERGPQRTPACRLRHNWTPVRRRPDFPSVLAEVRRRDERIDFAYDDTVLFELGSRREAEAKKRALRRRVNAVLRNGHERSPRIDIHDASAALRAHEQGYRLHCDYRPQQFGLEDFVKHRGIDLLHRGRIAAPRIVHEAIDAAVMPVHGAHGFPHAIKLRHVYGDRQAAWKLPRQFFERIGAASEQGDFRAPPGQSDRRDSPIPDEAPVTMKTRSLICIV